MILIIEGADLVGKSTVAEYIASRQGWPVVKIRWALQGDPEIETRAMATATIEILRATRPNVIFDRIYFSWWAYAPVLGYDAAYMPEIIAQFEAVPDARLVLLTASTTSQTSISRCTSFRARTSASRRCCPSCPKPCPTCTSTPPTHRQRRCSSGWRGSCTIVGRKRSIALTKL